MFAEKLLFGEFNRFPQCALLVLSIQTQLSRQGSLTLGLPNVTRSMPEYFYRTIIFFGHCKQCKRCMECKQFLVRYYLYL